ncbi:MAG: hypothetical protein HC785_11620 [Calothrix sp. CSU_2_0]|nr:hypothetical protein [Calothrix sp. CSU_2_0]
MSNYESGQLGNYQIKVIKEPNNLPSIELGQELKDISLNDNDLNYDGYQSDYYIKEYQLDLNGLILGEAIQINLNSNEFDAYLEIYDAKTRSLILSDNDSGANNISSLNSRIMFYPESGKNYILRVTTFSVKEAGEFTLIANKLPSISIFNTDPNSGSKSGSIDVNDLHNYYYYGELVDTYQVEGISTNDSTTVKLELQPEQITDYEDKFGAFLQVIEFDADGNLTGQTYNNFDDKEYWNDYYQITRGKSSELTFISQPGYKYQVRVISYDRENFGNYKLKASTAGSIDLEITEADVKPSSRIVLDEDFLAEWTVKNKGTLSTWANWYDYIYLSTDNQFMVTIPTLVIFSAKVAPP